MGTLTAATCSPTICGGNQYVSSNACTACPAGSTKAAGDDASGSDTTCACAVDMYVSSNVCLACSAGHTRVAGDPVPGADTACSPAAQVSITVTYALTGYTEETFTDTEKAAFVAAIANLISTSPTNVRVVSVTNILDTSGRRRLMQTVVGVDVEFVVDVLNDAVASSVGSQLDSLAATDSASLIAELKAQGLTSTTGVTLTTRASTSINTPSDKSSSSSNMIPTIAGAVFGSFTAVIGTVFIFFKKQLRRFLLKHGFKKLADFVQKDIEGDVRQMEVKMEELERFLAKQKLPRLKDVTPELTESNVHISNDDVLGTGGYGAVYKGEHNGNAVAVKAMFGSGDSKMKIPESASNMMRREAMIMCSLNHPNILRVIGIVPARGWIVMELCARGSLSELLRDPEQAVDAKMSARIAAEAATGIAYLHMRDVDIVHGDMKADNCLLADDLSVRICDFGMSEVKNRSKTMTAASTGSGSTAITVAWSAPELFRAKPKSYASDVYALGLTLWEIYERAIPFSGMPEAAIVNQVLSGARPDIGEKLPKEVERLIKMCWSDDPKARPTSGKVAYILTDLSTSLSSGLGEKIIAAAVGKEIASEMKKASGVVSKNIGKIATEVGKDVVNAVKEDMTGSFASDAKDKIDDELK